jgi:hypothetical protein
MSNVLTAFREDVTRANHKGRRIQEVSDATGIPFATLRHYYYIKNRGGQFPIVDRLRLYYEARSTTGE